MGGRINTIMQTCFFALSGVLPRDEAIGRIKDAIEKTYAQARRRGRAAELRGRRRHAGAPARGAGPGAVDQRSARGRRRCRRSAPDFVARVTALMLAGKGDAAAGQRVPRRRHLADRHGAVGEARTSRAEIPVWDAGLCIQCNKCAFVCPHAAIRAKVYPPAALGGRARRRFKSLPTTRAATSAATTVHDPGRARGLHRLLAVRRGLPGQGQGEPAPQGARHGAAGAAARAASGDNYAFFLGAARGRPRARASSDVKGTQFLQPLFEYSGACAGCGETPYLKLLTQLFGDRLLIANATGCSSIYGGNLPTTPYTHEPDGRGPAWANSLFEDNAEFGSACGWPSISTSSARARAAAAAGAGTSATRWSTRCSTADQRDEAGIAAQRERVAALQRTLAAERDRAEAARLLGAWPTTWCRRASGSSAATAGPTTSATAASTTCWRSARNVNMLVLDTEVYSNTGGQQSKATPTRRRGEVRRRRQGRPARRISA